MPGDLTTVARVETHVPDEVYDQWRALDKFFLQYLATNSLALKVVKPPRADEEVFVACLKRLLPSLVGKGELGFGPFFGYID